MNDSALLKVIYENVLDGIIIIDIDGFILSINSSACTMFGYTVDELNGQPAGMLVGGYEQLGLQTARQRSGDIWDTGHSSRIKAIKKDGVSFPAQMSVSKVMDRGRQIYTVIVHDLSDEKKAEAQQQYTNGLEAVVEERTKFLKNIVQTLEQAKDEVNTSLLKEKEVNQLKTRFVSLASHEFRTPLSSIQLSASLIERYYDRLERSKVFYHLHKIKLAIGDLTSILEDFLSVERIDSGKVEPEYTRFDLQSLCGELATEMQAQAKTGQNITYEHSGLSLNVLLDKKLLRHCLINLLSNAIKYSGANSVISMKTDVTETGCQISIADNGIGIPAMDQVHLFEAFFRAHNTTDIQGTGLGLNIVKRYIDLMNGRISFESVEQVGTTFTLSFPATSY